jgi:hypothetical protein
MSLKLIIKTKILEICTDALMDLRKFTNLQNQSGNFLADSQSVLNRWKNFFNQVLNVHGVHDVRRTDINTAEPLVPQPIFVEVETAIA